MVQAPTLTHSNLQPAPGAAPPAPEAPAPEAGAKTALVGQEKLAAKDGFAAPVPVNVARQPAEPIQTTADLFKDARDIGTPRWNLGVAKALTADGTVRTPLSFAEKASLMDLVRK